MGQDQQPSPVPDSYADPQDLEFSTAAAQKEERLDEALERGEDIPADEPPEQRPSASTKAQPPGGRRPD